MRHWLRRLLVVFALLVLASLAMLLVLDLLASRRLAVARERFEHEVGGLEEIPSRPELAANANAATWIQAAAAALVLSREQQEEAARLEAKDPTEWTDSETAHLQQLVSAAAPAFEVLDRAVPLPDSSFEIDYAAGFSAEVPDLMAFLRMTRIVGLDARLAIENGEPERLLRDLARMTRIADALADESLVITALVALGVDRRYLSLLADSLPFLTADDAERLAGRLGSRSRRASVERALLGDARLLERTPLAEVASETLDIPRSLVPAFAWLSAGWYKRETARSLDLYRDLIVSLDEDGPTDQTTEKQSFILVPNLRSMIARARAIEASRLLAQTALETLAVGKASGRYPAEPPRAVGSGSDPFTGSSLVYEVRPQGSAMLAAPEADALWRRLDSRPPPPFRWELPVPTAPTEP